MIVDHQKAAYQNDTCSPAQSRRKKFTLHIKLHGRWMLRNLWHSSVAAKNLTT